MARINAHINPDVLRWAREERGFALEEAAKKIRVSPEKLAASERGEDKLTFPQLRAAAIAYKRPTAAFYLNETPHRLQIPEFRRLPLHGDEPVSPELRLEIRKIHQKRKAAVELEEFGEDFHWDYVGSTELGDDPESLASKIRGMLRIPEDFPAGYRRYKAFNYWRSSIEDKGTLVFQMTGIPLEETRGLAIGKKPYPLIAVNRKDPPEARSFTLLHEFCHVLIADSTVCEIQYIPEDTLTKSWKIEKYCNHAAGAVLVPKYKLLGMDIVQEHGDTIEWTENELSDVTSHFRVSREVVLRRLLILGKTTGEFYRKKRNQWLQKRRNRTSSEGFGQPGYKRVLQTHGTVLPNLAISAMDSGAITAVDVAEILGMRLKHLADLRAALDKERT